MADANGGMASWGYFPLSAYGGMRPVAGEVIGDIRDLQKARGRMIWKRSLIVR